MYSLCLLHWRQILYHGVTWASLVVQLVKNPPGKWDTGVQSLGWEDPVEKGKATHSSILAWRIHGLCSSWGHKESDTTEQLSPAPPASGKLCLYPLAFLDYWFLQYPLRDTLGEGEKKKRWR